ncbi:MAG: quinolinate synthase NadA [Candidatus Aerophobetes bacterium]
MEKLRDRIAKLKEQRDAAILAHNYQLAEVQDIADFVGDSLDLSRKAARTQAKVIVFCGVQFMAETAAIMCPDKMVLLPELAAGCPMADMITPEALKEKRKRDPDLAVVCYVNSSAEVKAESDICCTSANAVKIVKSLDGVDHVLFVPDQYLGQYVGKQTGKELIFWPGYCPTHLRILPQDIVRLKRQYPGSRTYVHPECRPEVIELADEVQSTGGICRSVKKSQAQDFIIGTEIGIIHRLRRENPEKRFLAASEQAICPNMKLITLEKVLWSLEEMQYPVKVPEEIARKARAALDRMLSTV